MLSKKEIQFKTLPSATYRNLKLLFAKPLLSFVLT